MNDFFQRLSPKPPPPQPQPLNPNQGLRMIHAPPLLPNSKGKKSSPPRILSDAPLRLHIPNNNNRNHHHQPRDRLSEEELTVTNLRKLYSSLLEEMAPLHHEIGTGGSDANYRWKNSGTVTVNGSDDDGYDYSYTPDNSKKSWRLQRNLPGVAGGGGGGITGGDWSKDGIRRYYTGGIIEHGGGGRSENVISVGGMDVDVGTMNGVELSPKKKKNGDFVDDDGVDKFDHNFSIDDDDDSGSGSNGSKAGSENDAKVMLGADDTVPEDVDISASGSSLEDVALESTVDNSSNPAPSSTTKSNDTSEPTSNDSSNISFIPSSNKTNNMTTFESLYHLSPTMTWRLRSAYSPKTPHEQHLSSLGSEILAQRHPKKADGIMNGLEVARNCEARVCDGLRRIGELISYCERLKGTKFAVNEGGKFSHGSDSATVTTTTCNEKEEEPSTEEDRDDLEAAEAVFAYFCEKNVLPMLIDSLLCHPPPLTSSPTNGGGDASSDNNNMSLPSNTTTIGSSPSPFSGVTWTSTVKAQILQTISMILFNTSSPLSLTYLLSNNYMNELIMGMLPLDQWKEDALEEILPPYITLLRGLVMRLRGDEGKCCLPLFLCQRTHGATFQDGKDSSATETYIPLLYAAVQVFCSPFGTSLRDREGSLIRTTAMNVILNLCRITDPEVRLVLVQGGDEEEGSLPTTKSAPSTSAPGSLTVEQELLFPHICNSLKSWFHRSVRLVMVSLSIDKDGQSKHNEAKAEARARHKEIASQQFRELQYWLGFLDDLLSCDIRAWNARLVEWFLREVVVSTVLLRWNRALEVIGRRKNDRTKAVYTAIAEIRVSMVFLTQLFGMVEYSPLVRLTGAAVLHHKYPHQWCGLEDINFEKEDGFFVVTPAINAMISRKSDVSEDSVSARSGEEADAGGGSAPLCSNQRGQELSGEQEGLEKRGANEMDHRALETVAARHNFHQLAEEVENKFSDHSIHLSPNRHRTALLEMLAGNSYLPEETMLASMLLSTVLENDAIDDQALEIFGVLLGEGDIQLSPFETSIAQYLSQDWSNVEHSHALLYATFESVSSLGLMLLERIIYHTWTESGRCLDVVPFDHYYKSSTLVQALGTSLSYFSSQAQSCLPDANTIREICSGLISQRFSSCDVDPESPREDELIKLTCSLQSLYPSNFIDNASVLTEINYDRVRNESEASAGDLFLFNREDEVAKFAIQMTLHLRSLVGCIYDLYQRVTMPNGPCAIASNRWYWEGGGEDVLSFRTAEVADEILLAIGGIQATRLPEIGKDIDLRGRNCHRCSLPRKSRFGRNVNRDIIIDANGVKIVVTDKVDLLLVIDPSEIYVAKAKREETNRCTVLAVIPLQTIIASATEGELFHIVCNAKEKQIGPQSDIIKNGTMSLRFERSELCLSVKEMLDKHCSAYEKKIMMDMTDMLEKCSLMGGAHLSSTSQSKAVEDSWCDFQQA